MKFYLTNQLFFLLSPIVFSDLESDKFLQCHQLIISKGGEISEGIFIFALSSKWSFNFLTLWEKLGDTDLVHIFED